MSLLSDFPMPKFATKIASHFQVTPLALATNSNYKASILSMMTDNNCQMSAILRRLLRDLSKPGLIKRLREAGSLNSLADICCWVGFYSADFREWGLA